MTLGLCRRLAQAFAAQAVLAILRHRQSHIFFGAPARTCARAGEFRSASGADDAAGGLDFQTICHESLREIAPSKRVYFASLAFLWRPAIGLGAGAAHQ